MNNCVSLTKAGKPCRARANDRGLCDAHDPSTAITRDDIRQQNCPECEAEPGETCYDKHGQAREHNHFSRMQAAQKALNTRNQS